MIRKLLKLLDIEICNHKFFILKEIKEYSTPTSIIPRNFIYILQCEKCGRLKSRKY